MRALFYLFAALTALFLSPAIIGLVDMWAWIVLGVQVTGTHWEIGRVTLTYFLLLPSVLCMVVAMAARDAAGR